MIYKNNDRSKIESAYMIIALSLFSVDFKLQGVTVFLVAALVFFTINHRVSIDASGAILICFGVTFFLFFFPSQYFDISIVKTVLAVMLAYLLGYSQDNITESTVINTIKLIAIFMALHGVLNLLYNLSIFGTQAFSIARSYDFWSQAISGSTGQATKFTPFLSVFFYLLFVDKKFKSKLIAGILVIAMTLYNIELGGRSYFILFAIATFTSYLIYGLKSDTFKKSVRILLVIVGIAIIFVVIYQMDIFGVKTTVESSYFFHRFFSVSGQKINEDDRVLKKIEYLKNMWNYPFGGSNIRTALHIGYAHELWLDIFDMVGIVPYVLLVGYTFAAIARAIRVFRTNGLKTGTYVIVGTLYLIMLVQFFIEPVIYGSPKLVIAFCLIDGLVARLQKTKKEIVNYES